MNIKYLIERFEQRKEVFVGKTSWFRSLVYGIDYLFSYLIQGASVNDYFAYGFYKLRLNGRNEFITYRRYHKMMRIANQASSIHLCRNKADFNRHFSDFLGREWLDLSEASEEEIRLFVERHDVIFVKEVFGFRGSSVKRFDCSDKQLPNILIQMKNEKDAHYIIEEKITEHDELLSFHPSSVNTIRVVTLYDSKNDVIHIMNARIRIGNNNNVVDNFHYNGIGANIDVETGIISGVGYDTQNKTYLCHPVTGKQIIGFQVPQWKDCLEFVKSAVRKLPTVRYVGWDIVLKNDNTFCLIEANDNADHDFQQMYNRGLWKDYKKLLRNLK